MSNHNISTQTINAQISAIQSQTAQTGDSAGLDEYNYPYVIFRLFENKFAVNCKYVVSIEHVAETTEIVNTSRDVRGISYYKNEPIGVFDLRSLFGLMSKEDHTNNIVNLPQRIKDHEIYAQTLEECVNSGKPFDLNVNPNECAFGKWFNVYKESNPDTEVLPVLRKLEHVHTNFHDTAKTVRDLLNRKETSEAAKYVEEVNEMKDTIVKQLGELYEVLTGHESELNIILQLNGKKIGLIIDAAESVEEIDEIQELPLSVSTTKYIQRLGLSKKEKNIIFIIEAAEFSER